MNHKLISQVGIFWVGIFCLLQPLSAEEPGRLAAGYHHLVETPYLPPYFDQETFDNTWRVWPEPWKSKAEEADLQTRRKMAFERYGFTPRPDRPDKPLQYVVDQRGVWTLNCFACHGGQVDGQVVPGLPNNRFAFATITDEVRLTKVLLGKPLTRNDLSSALFPLGTTRGTTNAVNFGVALLALRDADLNVVSGRSPGQFVHHDLDAPPWWHFSKKEYLYLDGFAPKGHRGLMQFTLVPQNDAQSFRDREDDFREVYNYLMSLEPPKYSGQIDAQMANAGRLVFDRNCAECHGTYGDNPNYPERMVPIDEIGTDRARFESLSGSRRQSYVDSWFNHYNDKKNGITEPDGYVAPPLDGIWASAPYLHNGSVPTLWHLLRPGERPKLWKHPATASYDHQRLGIKFEQLEKLPTSLTPALRREIFDTSQPGKSAAGHDFPAALTEAERISLLEYLKTL